MFAADPAKAVALSSKLVVRVVCVMGVALAATSPVHSQQSAPLPANPAPASAGAQASPASPATQAAPATPDNPAAPVDSAARPANAVTQATLANPANAAAPVDSSAWPANAATQVALVNPVNAAAPVNSATQAATPATQPSPAIPVNAVAAASGATQPTPTTPVPANPANGTAAASAGPQPAAGAQPAPPNPATPATKAAPVRTFDILEFQIEGNTRLAVLDIERAVNDYLGENKTFKDIEGARRQLERVYHDHGYQTVLVNIPRQPIKDGIVHLSVVEAPVGKLRILGSRYHSLDVIRDKLVQVDPGTVPEFGALQKELGDVNKSADLHVTPRLRASETPGKVDVDLQVDDQLPLHTLLEVNNRYSANTTHPRVVGEVHYDNLFQMNQSINLQVQVAPMLISDAKVASLSYVIPTSSGPVWALYAVYSDSNVAAVGNLDVLGKGNIYGIRWIDPLPTSSPDFYNSVTLGADYKDFKQTVLLQDSGESIESPVKYPAFIVDYTGTWLEDVPADARTRASKARAATSGGRSSTSIDFNINFLIRGLGTDWRDFANKRAYAGTSYIFIRPSITREQVLPGLWSLVGRVDGQLSSGPLINNEQYAAGGSESVRGYTEAERLGDDAFHGSLELRTPQLLTGNSFKIEQSYLGLFAEASRLTIARALPSQESGFNLASAGLALRFKAGGLYVALDGARTFKQGTVTDAARFRGLFRVSYSY